ALGEIGGGSLGAVGAGAAEELAFEGELNKRDLLKQGLVGGAFSAPGAMARARAVPVETPTAPSVSGVNPAIIEGAAQGRPAPAGPQPIDTAGQTAFKVARTPGGAIPMPKSSLPSRKLLMPGRPEDVPTEKLVSNTRP